MKRRPGRGLALGGGTAREARRCESTLDLSSSSEGGSLLALSLRRNLDGCWGENLGSFTVTAGISCGAPVKGTSVVMAQRATRSGEGCSENP